MSRFQALSLGELSGLDELPPTPPTSGAVAPAAVPEDAGPPKPLTDRDIQRQALRDLVALSSESAAVESDVEREYRTGREDASKSAGDRAFGINQRHEKAVAEAEQQAQAKLGGINQRYKAERQKIAAADAAAKQKAEADKKGVDGKLKRQFDEKVFAADTELDASNHRTNLAYQQAAGRVEAAQEELNGLEVSAGQKVVKYGLRMPTDAVTIGDDHPAVAGITADADAAFAAHRAEAEQTTAKLGRLPLAKLTIPARAILITIVVGVAAAAAAQAATGNFNQFDVQRLGIIGGAALVVTAILVGIGRLVAVKQVRAIHGPVRESLAVARRAAEQQVVNAAERRKLDLAAAADARAKEVAAAKAAATPVAAAAAAARTTALAAAAAEAARAAARLDKMRDAATAEAKEAARRVAHDIEHKKERDLKETQLSGAARGQAVEDRYRQRRTELEQAWAEGLARIQTPIDQGGEAAPANLKWDAPQWKAWKPNKVYASRVRFGELHVDLSKIADNVPQRLTLPDTFALPALLAFPGQGSPADPHRPRRPGRGHPHAADDDDAAADQPAGRPRAVHDHRPGRAGPELRRLHAPDRLRRPAGRRPHLDQPGPDRREAAGAGGSHGERDPEVPAERVRHDRRVQRPGRPAGRAVPVPGHRRPADELHGRGLPPAERHRQQRGPVRRLHADRPGRAGAAAGRGAPGRAEGPQRQPRPRGRQVRLGRGGVQAAAAAAGPAGQRGAADRAAAQGRGRGAGGQADRGAVRPDRAPGRHMWSRSTTKEVDVMVGRTGATRFQSLKLGKGTSQHVLIAGKTGSGKSTLMHAMITNAALWYSPDEIELYLVDFKKGVEFKTYATNLLPHARAIAIESDREFGLSFADAARPGADPPRRTVPQGRGLQNLEMYRNTPNAEVVPRTLLIIDEYQEFFTEDDRLAQDATLLIERLVRQGRAFGMHVLLGSQTAGGLPRGVMEQFAVRIALSTTEAGSQIILGDNNSAARLLTRPGEAIYNDGGGLVENNSPFQVAFLSDESRDAYLKDLASKAEPYFKRFGYPIVFEGNAAADTTRNAKLNNALDAAAWPRSLPGGALGWLGEPVAIKDPTAIQFRRNAGVNVLTVGQSDEQVMAMFNMMIVSLAAQQGPQQASIYVLDGTPADSQLAGTFEKTAAALPDGQLKLVEFKATADAMDEIADRAEPPPRRRRVGPQHLRVRLRPAAVPRPPQVRGRLRRRRAGSTSAAATRRPPSPRPSPTRPWPRSSARARRSASTSSPGATRWCRSTARSTAT